MRDSSFSTAIPRTSPAEPSAPAAVARPAIRRRQRGFTILEVAVAGFVLAMGVATSLTVLQYGLRSIDTARNMTLAGQVMQSAIEILRLQNWSQIVALQAGQASPTTPTTVDPATTITSGSSTSLDSTLTTIAGRFTCTRLIEDISSRSDIKQITLNVSWTGLDGRAHNLLYKTRYAKNGLADYLYVSH